MSGIKGLNKYLYDEESYTFLYLSEDMVGDGIAIEVANYPVEEENMQLMVNVHHLNKIADIELDSATYTLYWDKNLSPIQIHGIVKNIFEIYTSNTLAKFVEYIDELSEQIVSSSMQTNDSNANEVLKRIKSIFEFVKSASND